MLLDEREQEIMKDAPSDHLGNPSFSNEPFKRVFKDWFSTMDFTGRQVLDLGPGQCDMLSLFHAHGAVCSGFDKKPEVRKLGQHRGFDMYNRDFKRFKAEGLAAKFDGVFCRYSFNCFWFRDTTPMIVAINELCKLAKPEGWMWFAPWNMPPAGYSDNPWVIQWMIDAQNRAFQSQGFDVFDLMPALAKRYDLFSPTPTHPLYVRNLTRPTEILNGGRDEKKE